MNETIIAIDYDDTISLNVDAWRQIISLLSSLGFVVYVVTYRESTKFDDMALDIEGVRDYLFTNSTAKKKYCSDIVGIEIDIWIDDCPASVIFDYKELLKHI